MVCKKCKSHRMHRIRREGFLRVKLAPMFGFFPWECFSCRHQQLVRTRTKRQSSPDKDKPREEALSQAAGQPRPSQIS